MKKMALYLNKTLYSTLDHPDSQNDHVLQTDTIMHTGLTKGIPITMFFVGIIANALLTLYLARSGRFKSPLFMLITSLSVTDLGTCFGAISYIVFLYPVLKINNTKVMCPLTVYITAVLYVASVYHLVLFACLRYAQLVHPLWSRARITCQVVFKACAFIWILCLISQSYFTVFMRALEVRVRNNTETEIICTYTANPEVQEAFSSIYGFFLPSILIVVIHVVKEIRLKYKLDKSLSVPDGHRLRSDPRALTIVVVLYYITWIPNVMHLSAHVYFNAPHLGIHNYLHFGLRLLTYFNSVLDPFVYCFASKTVRKDMLTYFCGGLSKVKLNLTLVRH